MTCEQDVQAMNRRLRIDNIFLSRADLQGVRHWQSFVAECKSSIVAFHQAEIKPRRKGCETLIAPNQSPTRVDIGERISSRTER